MRIASRWAKTGSLKVLGDTQHPWQHVLRLGHIQATRRCRGIRDRAVWQAVWNSAVFRCILLYDAPYMYHASSRLPPGAIQPYSAIQRCMSIQLYSTIQHTAHTTPLSFDHRGHSNESCERATFGGEQPSLVNLGRWLSPGLSRPFLIEIAPF